jgi:hypothetical protein
MRVAPCALNHFQLLCVHSLDRPSEWVQIDLRLFSLACDSIMQVAYRLLAILFASSLLQLLGTWIPSGYLT